tara:strand:+ start:1021 stop:1662 length:642 start_codon:yes stop_codon:yes gene_type:complete
MAANEHKNLSDINRHNPKGFENAINDTVLSKDIGTSATGTDGNLVWQNKSLMGVTNHKMQGYTDAGTTNYAYGEDIKDNKSPFIMDVDYGSSSVSLGTITPANFFRIGQAYVVSDTSVVTSINGWLTCDSANTVTIAICKITPVVDVSTAVTPIVIDEIAVTGLSSNGKGVRVNETTITTADLAVGDIIFAMIKESVAGSEIYMNLNIQATSY